MADKKISQLTDGTSLQSGDFVVIARSGDNFKVDPTQFGSDISLGDNVKATFGDSSDLQIYHDGSNSYIKDAGTGNLLVQADNFVVLETTAGINYFQAQSGGAATIYYNGSAKLATTATGVDVTGTVTADGVTATTGDFTTLTENTTPVVIQTDIGTDPNQVPLNQYLGSMAYQDLENVVVGELTADGLAVDTDTLYVDATNNRVGVGTTSPSQNLEIASTFPAIRLTDTDASNAVSEITGGSGILALSADGTGAVANSRIVMNVDGSETMRIDASGNVGIGTTSPVNELEVYSANSPRLAIRAPESIGESIELGFQFGTAANASANTLALIKAVPTQVDPSPLKADLAFFTNVGDAIAERMRIDASGQVGIGTDSPDTLLELVGNDPILTIRDADTSSSTATATIRFAESGAGGTLGNYWDVGYSPVNALTFGLNGSEAMRLDDSGNLLVGTTSGANSKKLSVVGDSGTSIAYIEQTTGNSGNDAVPALTLNRANRDGALLTFEYSGSTVGSIGVQPTSNLFIGGGISGGTGIRMNGSQVLPCTGDGTLSDDAKELGGSSNRWKNLYLSGGVYLGGTGAANLLDDYEEGTWTPVVADAATGGNTAASYVTQSGRYTKVGNIVYVYLILTSVDTTGMTSGNDVYIRGLPFTSYSSGSTFPQGTVKLDDVTYAGYVTAQVDQNTTNIRLQEIISAATHDKIEVSQLNVGNEILCSITYEVA